MPGTTESTYQASQGPLVAEFLPELARELEELLVKVEEPELAKQVRALRAVDRCRCTDAECGSFYTAPKPHGSWNETHRDVTLELSTSGIIILDVENEAIVFVEVLNRPEVRKALGEVFPPTEAELERQRRPPVVHLVSLSEDEPDA